MDSTKKPENIDEYIAGFPIETQGILNQVRATIKNAAPGAVEVISYSMPAFKQNGMLVWFAAYKNHIGFYPTASGISAFKNDLSIYKNAKGSVQFPIDKPMPLDLISKMVKFKIQENSERSKAKKKILQ
jgi:uncharacterized protein YdhG (YjbR/CyaY superfamily)